VRGNALAFAAKNEGTSLELDIYDVIGDDLWGEGVAAKGIRDCLKRNQSAKNIKVRINSRGGIVTDGIAIYNMLSEHPANVEVQIDALAASIASVIAMAGDSIKMASNGFVMIHNPSGMVCGDADEMRSAAEALDKMRSAIADTYVARTGQCKDSVLAAMDEETWYTAEEAKALGYIDEIIPAKKMAAVASIDLSGFRNVPDSFRSLMIHPPTGRANNEGNTNMRNVALALGLPDTATEGEVLTALARAQTSAKALDELLALIGEKSADAARGVIVALQAASTRVAELESQVKAFENAKLKEESDSLLASLEADGKITPAQKAELWPTLTLEGKRSFAKTAVKVLGASNHKEKQHDKDPSGALTTADGKKWEELAPKARADLYQSDKALYDALKEDYEQRSSH
jgi:ATP-dependent Clp endopeptidase proteolytic subunit ClpP